MLIEDSIVFVYDFLFAVKIVNRQLITVFNFILTVVGSFAFAYKAAEYAMETPNFAVVSIM